jgi:hypothetical protein
MPDLGRNVHFGGDDDVAGEDLGGAEVAHFSIAVDTALRQNFDWDGKAIGAVGLTLTPDNDRVASGLFVTRGETDLDEYRAPCDQIWPNGPRHITFAVRASSLDPFIFSSGGLWSDLMPSHRFTHSFYNSRRQRRRHLGRLRLAGRLPAVQHFVWEEGSDLQIYDPALPCFS